MSEPTSRQSVHAARAEEVFGTLDVDPDTGLSDDEVAHRRERYGRNVIGASSTVSRWRILWEQVASVIVGLLVVAAGIGLAIGEVVEAGAIVVILVVNTIVGFVTELRATRSMESLRGMLTTVAEVERGDRRDEVEAAELVPGDVVGIEAGERVPADLRIFEAEDLAIEEASLTGESEPVHKQPEPVDESTSLAERTCMAFMGTTVQTGRGRGVVVATGTDTEVGRVAEMVEQAEEREAPLQAGLEQLGQRLSIAVVLGAIALGGIGLLRGDDLREVLEVSIALAIAVVPEGLPAVATLTLAVGMQRIAARGALVQRLAAVETLGSTTVICSDKTGTLTTNEMEVTEVHLAERRADSELWPTAVLANDADVDPDGDPVGDPTEVALLHAAAERDLDWRSLREEQPRSGEVPFSSETKRMAVVVDGTVHAKGAPEVMLVDDGPLATTAEDMAERALRTLAFARGDAPAGSTGDEVGEEVFDGLEVLGAVGMQDPPRPEAIEAVAACHRAGIRVVMITGDRPTTASTIADTLGLSTERVVTGSEVADLGQQRMDEAVAGVDVFARVDPEHKLAIVSALQQAGEIVAVTGDGVNDAPALRQADIGVAMGNGTDVAKEAGDIVLVDDDFSTIEAAVEEGRRIFENIRRFGQFLFSWHLAEVAVVTVGIVLGLDPPIAGLMILWNNLIIDVLPSFALALEPGADESMNRPPRPPGEPVINRSVLTRLLTQGGLVAAVGMAAYTVGTVVLDAELAVVQTMVFLTISAAQVLTVFNARSDTGNGFAGASRNRWLWAALGITAALEALALFVPPLRDVLGLAPLPAAGWLTALLLIPIPLLATQTVRIFRART